MTRAIISAFRMYTPFGKEYYDVLFDFFIQNCGKYQDEYDHLYILSSQWDFTEEQKERVKQIKGEIIWTDPSLRYFDAYKTVLPRIQEDLVMLLDNDTVIYKPGVLNLTFNLLSEEGLGPDVAAIYDTIGTYQTDKLGNGKNKFCPYFFATRKDLLMKYLDVEWGPTMPYAETLGLLTEAMLNDGVRPYEIEEDKNSIYFDGVQDEPKNLGYYHVRSGSLPAYLLATKRYGDQKTYWDYLNNQPKREYLRQVAWMMFMYVETGNKEVQAALYEIIEDAGVTEDQWTEYMAKFDTFHGLTLS